MAVKAPTERNFRRARVKPARKSRFRPRISWTVVRRLASMVLLVFGVYQTASLAFTTPLLRVRKIAVHGNVRLSSGQVQALVEDLRGTSMLGVDLEAFRRRLTESPWVADVALRRVLPSTIEVFISERRPIGLCRLGQDLYLIDESGTIIDQFGPQYAEFDLPIIDGLVSAPNTPASMQGSIDPKRAGLAARVIASLGRSREIGGRLSQVDVATPTTQSCCSRETGRCYASATTSFSSGFRRIWTCRARSTSASRRSIMWTFGSISVCTSGRPRARGGTAKPPRGPATRF